MSALAGIWTRGAEPEPNAACTRMLASQAIYGPHATNQWNSPELSLGRRLFRLLPEDIHDRQPLVGAGGRLVLVADLRLDNREDLEAELNIPRDQARGLCDAALLLAAWERWEETCFDHLVGNYAFALWDRERQRLLLARDPLGHRPLHYHRGTGFFAFASMPKGLHALPEVPVGPDQAELLDFLALMPEQGSRSFFIGIERVEPGCLVTVTADGVHARRHWRPIRRPIKLAGADEYAQALREHLDRAVRAQLRGADGRIGAHLSAGWDSSAVTATAARLLAPSGGRVAAFTSVPRLGYTGAAPRWRFGDEGTLAAATAAQYANIDHVLVRSTGQPPTDGLDRDYFLYDRPLLNLCNFAWLHEINRQARDCGLSIVLVGYNGNLTLSYDGLDRLPELIAAGRFVEWLRQARAVVRAGDMRWGGALFYSLGPWIPGRLWNWLNRVRGAYGGDVGHYTAIEPARLPGLRLEARLRAFGQDPFYRPAVDPFRSRLANLQWIDNGNYVKGALGGWGIDLRDPTSDRRLIEFCLNVPGEQHLTDGRPRALARRALSDRLPAAVLENEGRGYQAADWHESLTAAKDEVADKVAHLEGCAPAAWALNIPRLRRLMENWPTDGWERDENFRPYRYVLLRGLSVGHFLQRASGSNQ